MGRLIEPHDLHSSGRSPTEPFAVVGQLALGPGMSRRGTVVIDRGRIASIIDDRTDKAAGATPLPRVCFEAAYVAPGFVDLQVNGAFGFEVSADSGAVRSLAQRLPATGVTTFLPTLVSMREHEYATRFQALATVRAEQAARGIWSGPSESARTDEAGRGSTAPSARIAGVHLEGPLLAVARAGVHDVEAISLASAELIARLAVTDLVRFVTVTPERPGALALIRQLCARNVVVSLGHTDATFEQFTAGIAAGATVATHLFNAMAPLHHRAPGAVGAALTDDRITTLVIADGVHVLPALLQLAARAKGPQRLGLATDCIAAAGLGSGGSRLAGQPVTVDESGAARRADGRLAGSTLTMDAAVRHAVAWAGLDPATAIHAATAVPARLLGLRDRGALTVGAAADLVLLDDALHVTATFVDGAVAYAAESP